MGLVALTENLMLLQFEFRIDYDAENGGKVLLKRNDVETVALLSKNWSQAEHYIDVKVDLAEMDITSAESKSESRLCETRLSEGSLGAY